MMRTVFWLSVAGVVYAYAGYLLLLWIIGRLAGSPLRAVVAGFEPPVTLIVPVHNEESRIVAKIENTRALRYPADRLEVLFVSDGSTDRTVEIIRESLTPRDRLIDLPQRGGKAAALNAGLVHAAHDILVFSDASIELEPEALGRLVRGFQHDTVGCISGEDWIPDSGR